MLSFLFVLLLNSSLLYFFSPYTYKGQGILHVFSLQFGILLRLLVTVVVFFVFSKNIYKGSNYYHRIVYLVFSTFGLYLLLPLLASLTTISSKYLFDYITVGSYIILFIGLKALFTLKNPQALFLLFVNFLILQLVANTLFVISY